MKKITLYIWQLGVNIIGLPQILKVQNTQQTVKLKGLGRNKDVFVTKNNIEFIP